MREGPEYKGALNRQQEGMDVLCRQIEVATVVQIHLNCRKH